ncbi:hypothetical protein N7488_002550 [Penicillium malachiteum]|nr:hypothetical protein N7488_002550 [Penicillium malachiteum]
MVENSSSRTLDDSRGDDMSCICALSLCEIAGCIFPRPLPLHLNHVSLINPGPKEPHEDDDNAMPKPQTRHELNGMLWNATPESDEQTSPL